jgi:NADH-quinone oxidoreductase subunit J
MPFLTDNLLTTLMLGGAILGLWLAMANRRFPSRRLGVAVATASLLGVVAPFETPGVDFVEQTQFWVYSIGAVFGAVSMIASREPVHGALWFAMATLSACGLFLLQCAPFLAAATVIVYAGAIIVTFLFVIMLAQQRGPSAYDRNPRRPTMAILVSIALLTVLIASLHELHGDGPMAAKESKITPAAVSDAAAAESLKLGAMHSLGRSLFVDHLLAVELAGTLLLIATVGAIILAPRRGTSPQ